MKINCFVYMVILSLSQFVFGNPSSPQQDLANTLTKFFEVPRLLKFGSPQFDSEVLQTLRLKGSRDQILLYMLQRSEVEKLDFECSYLVRYGSMYFKWADVDSARRFTKAQIRIEFDSNFQPVKVFSTIVRDEPQPEPEIVDLIKNKIDYPPKASKAPK